MRAFGFALVVFFLSACRTCPPRPPPPPGMLCRGDAECVAPFVCRDPLSDQPGTPLAPGNCTGNCRSDADCRGGRCRGSTCEPSVSTISWPDLLLEMDERPAPFEAAPWINFAGGFRSQPGGTTTASAVGAGIE